MEHQIKKNNLTWKPGGVWVKLNPNNVIGIALHHMAHPTADMATVHSWHLARWQNEPGFAYNYFVTLTGEIIEGRGDNRGAHTGGQNSSLIGIGFQGNYEPFNDAQGRPVAHRTQMPDAQYNAGVWLIKEIKKKYPKATKVEGHKGYAATACPGRFFPLAEMKVGNYRGQPVKETAALTYTVAAGDTLSKIAAAFNTTVDALAKLNGISNPNVIRVGQVLKIKEAVAAPTPEPVKPQPVTGTPIIGPATATVAQAQEWARNNRAPQAFIDLAPLVWSVAQKAFIDPAVVWVQFAHETGFLYRDGKSMAGIDASYFNPCGLKVTQGGGDTVASAHKRFKDWEEGLTAQVDHLALYAGAPGYPMPGTPDPRHFPYLKGTAPTVESLGGKWAPSATYGNHLATWLKAVQVIKVAEPVTPPAAGDDVKRLQERVAQLEKELEQANGRAVVAEREAAAQAAKYEKYEKVFKDIKTLMGGI